MNDRWKQRGWHLLQPTARFPEQLLHRPDPDRPSHVMCDRVIGDAPLVEVYDGQHRECGRCTLAIGVARRRAKQAVRSAARIAEQAKRAKEKALREQFPSSGSVHAASAGLPGLGRR